VIQDTNINNQNNIRNITLPEDVLFILGQLELAGHEAYIVGGCVRDILRGQQPKDYDIATSAMPEEIKKRFTKTFDTGIQHGTITVLLKNGQYEVTTYRIDGEYLDARRPESVSFSMNIYEDLSRRDFTMNAIAYNPKTGFVDPFDGRTDIEYAVVRCVRDAKQRFTEDALRMLRAIRFSATLGFSVDEHILTAIYDLKERLNYISGERIRIELGHMLMSDHLDALMLLESTGILTDMLRGRSFGGDLKQIIEHIKLCPKDEPMRLALFFSWAQENAGEILHDLRYDNKTIGEVKKYIKYLYEPIALNRLAMKQVLQKIDVELFEKLLVLKRIVGAINAKTPYMNMLVRIHLDNECYSLRQLALNGRDLMALGIENGEDIGAALAYLLNEVMMDSDLNTKAKLTELLLQYRDNSHIMHT